MTLHDHLTHEYHTAFLQYLGALEGAARQLAEADRPGQVRAGMRLYGYFEGCRKLVLSWRNFGVTGPRLSRASAELLRCLWSYRQVLPRAEDSDASWAAAGAAWERLKECCQRNYGRQGVSLRG